jgi:hypothetical protein
MTSTVKATKASERRPQVAAMYLEGKYQTDIATHFGVNQSTISRDLEAMRQQWQEQALLHFDEIKARELARIDRLEREYWQAWERSQENEETVKQVGTIQDGKLKNGRAEKTTRGQVGDATHLRGVQWCIEQRLKIFGVYEAVKLKIDHSWQDLATRAGIDPAAAEKLIDENAALLAAADLFAKVNDGD